MKDSQCRIWFQGISTKITVPSCGRTCPWHLWCTCPWKPFFESTPGMAFRGPASTPIDLMRGTTRSRDTLGTRVSRCGYPQVFPRQSWQSPRQSRQPDSKLSEWCRPPGAKVSTARPGSPWSTSWEYWVSKAPFVATPLTSLDSKAFETPFVATPLTSLLGFQSFWNPFCRHSADILGFQGFWSPFCRHSADILACCEVSCCLFEPTWPEESYTLCLIFYCLI